MKRGCLLSSWSRWVSLHGCGGVGAATKIAPHQQFTAVIRKGPDVNGEQALEALHPTHGCWADEYILKRHGRGPSGHVPFPTFNLSRILGALLGLGPSL